MRRSLKDRGLELAIVVLCAWQARDLWTAWSHSPFDRAGGWSFAIWLSPCAAALLHPSVTRPAAAGPCLLALAAMLSGRLLELNALLCLASALSLAPFVPSGPRKLFWLTGAVAWMPALGWLMHGLPTGAVSVIRLSIAAAAAAGVLFPRVVPTRSA